MTILTRYLLRRYLGFGLLFLAVLALATVMLLSLRLALAGLGEPLRAAGLLLRAGPGLVLLGLAGGLPAVLLLAAAMVGRSLSAAGEARALDLHGYGRGARLRLALALGLVATLLVAEASRELLPRLRRGERALREALALAHPELLPAWLGGLSADAGAGLQVDRVHGEVLEGVTLWRWPGLDQGLALRARQGRIELAQDRSGARLVLDDAWLCGDATQPRTPIQAVDAVALKRLSLELQLPPALGAPRWRLGHLTTPQLAAAAGAGAWSAAEVAAERSERLAEAWACLLLTLAGFWLGEAWPARADLMPYLAAVLALVLWQVLRTAVGRWTAFWPPLAPVAPWLPALAALGLAGWCARRRTED